VRENFRAINAGEVTFAKLIDEPPPFTTSVSMPSLTKVQRSGLVYEKKVQEHLRHLALVGGFRNLAVLSNQWISYRLVGDEEWFVRYCQPDCLLVEGDKITIIEIKIQHTGDSWKQVRQLYEPVLKIIFPSYHFSAIEICRWFDPHTPFPETFYYCEEAEIFNAVENRFGIHVFNSKGRGKGERASGEIGVGGK